MVGSDHLKRNNFILEPNIVKYQSDYQILISEIVW